MNTSTPAQQHHNFIIIILLAHFFFPFYMIVFLFNSLYPLSHCNCCLYTFFLLLRHSFLDLQKWTKTSRKGGIFFGKIKREENLCGNTFEFFVNKSVTHSEVEEGGHKYRTHRNTLELFVYTRKCLWKTLCAFFSHLPHHR